LNESRVAKVLRDGTAFSLIPIEIEACSSLRLENTLAQRRNTLAAGPRKLKRFNNRRHWFGIALLMPLDAAVRASFLVGNYIPI